MKDLLSSRGVSIFCACCGIIGVLMLIVSFSINPGPPEHASFEQLQAFGHQYYRSILWGAWLQAVGPFLIVVFAIGLVSLGGAGSNLSGMMTIFGAGVLMTVSLIEVSFYIAVLFNNPPVTSMIGLNVIYSVQHLYFIIGAPALFFPLGLVILTSGVLPRIFGWLAIFLGISFSVLGILFLFQLVLPMAVTALAGTQVFW